MKKKLIAGLIAFITGIAGGVTFSIYMLEPLHDEVLQSQLNSCWEISEAYKDNTVKCQTALDYLQEIRRNDNE